RAVRPSSTWARYNRHYGRNKINWGSLGKPALFTAIFCIFTTVSTPYVMQLPVLSYFKSHPKAIVHAIIGLNVAGFLAWRSPLTSRYMSRFGLLMKDNIRTQWALLGSAFSHQDPFHLLFNMLMLYSFGTSFAMSIGSSNFLTMYLNSAVISSFISIAIPTIMRTSLSVASLGASGALFGVFGAFSYLAPKAPVALFFLPVPGGAWFLFLGSLAINAVGIAFKWGRYDYAAHLGGGLAGAAYGWYLSKLRESRIRSR
ncbi:rhomboid-domain-containing protein, partial [Metschnikowia bicuspidata var. bicuspidata NRRL YB-4993]